MPDHTKYTKQLQILRDVRKVIKENKLLMTRILEGGFERIFIAAEIIDYQKSDIEGIFVKPITIKAHTDIYHTFRWS